jgi:hypothetical protein
MAASRSPWLSLAGLKITRTLSVAARWKANLTGGNRNDITRQIPLVDAVPPIRRRRGRPGLRPRELFADRGHDHDIYRRPLRARGITPRIACRGVAHGSGLGRSRWVVECGFAWLHASNGCVPAPTSISACSSRPAR